jgi:hypothetical protein
MLLAMELVALVIGTFRFSAALDEGRGLSSRIIHA